MHKEDFAVRAVAESRYTKLRLLFIVLEIDVEEEAPVPEEKKRLLGVYPDMPENEYRRAPGVNKSGMDNFMQSPLHYITMKKNPPPPTPQMFVGSAFHCLVLEPERFKTEYVQDKYRGSRAKEALAWHEAMKEEGKTVINTKGGDDIWSASDWDMIHHMRDAVMAHPIASILIQGQVEQSFFWIDKKQGDYQGTGRLCKARSDVYNSDHELLVDLKSTVDASYSEFQKSVHRYRYFIQDPFYSDGWVACGQPFRAFVFVVAEKQPPYGVACYTLNEEWRRVGREIYQRTLQRFSDCMDQDNWPCYPTEVRDLVMPGYGKFHSIS